MRNEVTVNAQRVSRLGPSEISRLRDVSLDLFLKTLEAHGYARVGADKSFVPVINKGTQRLLVSVNGGHQFQLIITGSKWFDDALKKGGGGSIDLAMHLTELNFLRAACLVRDLFPK